MDQRLKSDRQPLRQRQDITFLGSGRLDYIYLYESQVSCIITGSDRYVWAAYLFIDLYYNREGEGSESLEEYENEFKQLGSSGTTCDPLLRGEGIPQPIREPREYFLRCFDIRSRIVVNEWSRVVARVIQSINASVRVSFLFTFLFPI
jgi:hypothetical protein